MATEKRLIDAHLLGASVSGIGKGIKRPRAVELACLVLINEAPTVDAVEVVHGHWIDRIDNNTDMHECSVCGARVVKCLYEYENPNRYCYHCGAQMDLEVPDGM